MKAVMATVPPDVLAWRRRTGADQWDEMWEGVLHMTPSPNREHQDLEGSLEAWLRKHWAEPNGCRVYHQINVAEPGTWPKNYRIPDLVFLTPERFDVDQNEYFEGGPDAVVEIHSPDDEVYEKLPFYAKVGVREVWIIDRDSKQPELYELIGDVYRQQEADASGWLHSRIGPIQLRASAGKLEIQLVGNPASHVNLP